MKFGIIKERKNPPDRRVVFTPEELVRLQSEHPEAEIKVESSDIRIFSDDQYRNLGLNVTTDLSDCDVLFGVKEVPVDALIPNEKFQKYLEIQRSLAESRKQQKLWKKTLEDLEKDIKDYMTQNDMDSISLKDGEIVLYAKKISQTFKKEVIMEKLNEKLKDSQKAEELTQSILQNKRFIVEDKLRAVIKKNK